MMSDPDLIRRWTRAIGALRSRRLKVRRQDPAAAVAALEEILEESLNGSVTLLQDLAGEQLAREKLHQDLRNEMLNRQYLLERLPIACLSTDATGLIRHANQPAAELFNVSAKHLRGRQLLHFSADRSAFCRLLQELPRGGGQVEASIPMRPRERGPFTMNTLVLPEIPEEPSSWLWFFRETIDVAAVGPPASWTLPGYPSDDPA
jgi:PAS domain-containing protein